MKKLAMFRPRTPLTVATEVALVAVCMSQALPVVLAMQPQKMKLNVNSLEPEFRNKKDVDGKPVTHVLANKGQ